MREIITLDGTWEKRTFFQWLTHKPRKPQKWAVVYDLGCVKQIEKVPTPTE